MSRDVAREIAEDRLKHLRHRSYDELRPSVGQVFAEDVTGRDGVDYQVEVEIRWDAKAEGNIRVMVAVDGGGVSSIAPLWADLIIAPDGSVIG
jgi:hypothetical protein